MVALKIRNYSSLDIGLLESLHVLYIYTYQCEALSCVYIIYTTIYSKYSLFTVKANSLVYRIRINPTIRTISLKPSIKHLKIPSNVSSLDIKSSWKTIESKSTSKNIFLHSEDSRRNGVQFEDMTLIPLINQVDICPKIHSIEICCK